MKKQLLFIGDSLIEFFNWQERFPGPEIYNYGIAGETAEGLLARLPGITARVRAPDLVMIMTGTNNIAMEDYGFFHTYEKIIVSLQDAYSNTPVVMTSLLPISLYYLGDAVVRINIMLENIARERKVHYLDLYPLFLGSDGRARTSCFDLDGVHLSDEGYEVWAQAVENNLLPLLN